MRKAEITLPSDRSEIILSSLLPEIRTTMPRTKVQIESNDDVKLIIKAEDTNALRAGLNSYLRWIKVAIDVNKEVSK